MVFSLQTPNSSQTKVRSELQEEGMLFGTAEAMPFRSSITGKGR